MARVDAKAAIGKPVNLFQGQPKCSEGGVELGVQPVCHFGDVITLANDGQPFDGLTRQPAPEVVGHRPWTLV